MGIKSGENFLRTLSCFLFDNINRISPITNRLGQIFRMEKTGCGRRSCKVHKKTLKKLVFTLFKLNCFAKLLLQQDICLKSASYPLLPGLVMPNIETNSVNSKKRLHFS